MKKFIVTITLLVLLDGSVFAKDWVRVTCDNAKSQHIVNIEKVVEKKDCRGTTTEVTNSVLKVTPNNKEIELPKLYNIRYVFEMENVEIVYEQKGVQKSVTMFDATVTEVDGDYLVDITLSSDYWVYEKNLKLGNINELEYNVVNTKWEID